MRTYTYHAFCVLCLKNQAATDGGVRPIECACVHNHTAIASLLLARGVSSLVEPKIWMGLQYGTWLIGHQVPEMATQQTLLDELRLREEEDLIRAQVAREEERKQAAREERDQKKVVKGKAKGK